MNLSLKQLRHLAKEILGLATLELFPGTLLIGGGVDEVGFFYDFLFPEKIIALFSKQELENLDEHMHTLVYENRPLKILDMMRENAALFLEHLGQPHRAEQAAHSPENIVSLVQIGEFHDLCPPLSGDSINVLKAFKLLKFQILQKGIVRIEGSAFEEKEDLKEFLKKYKKASRTDPMILGPQLGYFNVVDSEKWIWLPKGEAFLWRLTNIWRELFLKANFSLITLPIESSPKEMHKNIIEEKHLKKVASLQLDKGDLATIYAPHKELFDTLISSLQFFQEAFKIFAFEIVVYYQAEKSSLLVQALEHLGIDFEEETRFKDGECVTFNSFDGYGRRIVLSSIEVEEKKGWVHHSLFYSLKHWMSLCIELDRSGKI